METGIILFLTNSEHGQASVTLAVAHELLVRSKFAVHIASFEPLAAEVTKLNKNTASLGSATRAAHFHAIPGCSMLECVRSRLSCSFDELQIGFSGALKVLSVLPQMIIPWDGAEYMAIYHGFVDIIEELRPVIVVLDPFLPHARDACRMTRQDRVVLLSPNTVKDLVVQPRLENLWKYPMACSGYPCPLPWRLILPNAYLAVRAAFYMRSDKNIREIMTYRKNQGLEGEMPHFVMAQDDPTPVLIPTTPEMDFPVSVPKSFTACGPILRPWTPVADAHPELNDWLSKRPTVVVNLGSIFRYSSAEERQFAEGFHMLLDKRPDIQILWKLPRVPSTDHDASALDSIADAVTDGRVRTEKWFPVEPISILLHKNVQCSVHHGGANSYYEAIRTGIPQVVLPVWFDTYDFAHRVEFLGIGVWGSRKTAPVGQGSELGEALNSVLVEDEGASMREKAKALVSQLGHKEGRVVACEKILSLIDESKQEEMAVKSSGNESVSQL
ncbi:hypothetical protein BJX96DRAFT_175896 [Aspergillus floccosus]